MMMAPGSFGGGRPQRDPYWLSLEVCREFVRNQCNRAEEDCKFAHPPPQVEVQNGKVTCCFDSLQERCLRTDPPCKYFHPPAHLREQLAQNRRQVSHLSSSLGMHTVLPNVLPIGNSPYHLLPFSPYPPQGLSGQHGFTSRLDPSMGATGSSSGTGALAAASANPQMGWMVPNLSATSFGHRHPRSDRIEVCREFQRGICMRSDSECRFAHPPDNLSVDGDNHITVCMDFIKGRCTRDSCRYFHPPPHLQSQIKSQHRTKVSHVLESQSLPSSSSLPSWSLLSSMQPTFQQSSPVAVSSYQQLAALALLQQQQQHHHQQQQQLFQNLPVTGPPQFPSSDGPRFL